MARVIGLLFSLAVAALTASVAQQASQLYVIAFHDVLERLPYFELTYSVLFMVLGLIVGFTAGSLIYRQTLTLGQAFISDLQQIPARDKVAVVLGVFMGLGMAALLGTLLIRVPKFGPQLVALVGILCVYIGVAITLSMKEEAYFFFRGWTGVPEASEEVEPALEPKLLDTNVIIDGRIADIARAGFVEGPIYVPDFVLEELHLIADSSDTLRRNRGRRGLDILNQMQQVPALHVRVYDRYAAPLRPSDPVDAKLVQLAKELSAAIVTNDFNLNKVAQLQGIRVMNVNELANAVKPVVLPGEEMTVTIVREGKEPEQGVAYLDDGTMVVVERGKDRLGETVAVVVTSVLQTVAGKMIFGYPRDEGQPPQGYSDRRSRDSSSSGTRRKAPHSRE